MAASFIFWFRSYFYFRFAAKWLSETRRTFQVLVHQCESVFEVDRPGMLVLKRPIRRYDWFVGSKWTILAAEYREVDQPWLTNRATAYVRKVHCTFVGAAIVPVQGSPGIETPLLYAGQDKYVSRQWWFGVWRMRCQWRSKFKLKLEAEFQYGGGIDSKTTFYKTTSMVRCHDFLTQIFIFRELHCNGSSRMRDDIEHWRRTTLS